MYREVYANVDGPEIGFANRKSANLRNSENVPLCEYVCDLKTQAIFADLKLPQVCKYIPFLHTNVTNKAPIKI
jgi:hypothetical protein